jgi:alpha-mannosidase
MSEPGFGVALLNDCKYGYDAIGNVVRLTLLKSPTYPWPDADLGEHRFKYAVLVHDGDLGAVHDAGEAFNAPLRLVPGDAAGLPLSFARIDGDGVSVACLKRAEDSDALVLRLYESRGARRAVAIDFNGVTYGVVECDLLEQPLTSVSDGSSRVALEFRPFEIKTLLLKKAPQPTSTSR